MKSIKITDSKKISSLQEEFHEMFPFLKLEFCHHKHNSTEGFYKKDIVNREITLKQCRKKPTDGAIVLKENMKVTDIGNLFQDVFGLSTQVFRKSGRSWIETTVTDDWTLKR